MKFIKFIALVCVFVGFSVANSAYALTISPVKIEITGDPGQTLRGELELLNEQNESKVFFSSFENFEPQGETGSPHFIGGDTGLATWLQVDPSVTVDRGQKKTVPFTITIPADAEAGGYFSAIFWGSQDPRTQEAGEVSIGGKLGVLILLRVAGDISEVGGVSEYGTAGGARFFSSLPIGFSYRFTNNGGDRVVPLGDIVIKNTFRSNSATLSANENEGSVLPNSARKFTTSWGKPIEGEQGFFATAGSQLKDFHFGLYTATLDIVWGATNQKTTDTFLFFIFPWQLFVLLALCVFVAYLGLKRYNKWIISKSNRGK